MPGNQTAGILAYLRLGLFGVWGCMIVLNMSHTVSRLDRERIVCLVKVTEPMQRMHHAATRPDACIDCLGLQC